ncbi:MAG: hypothetical protein AAGD07_06720 [Planctomycetota bacterium]
MTELILKRLEMIEEKLNQLLEAKSIQEWYDTKTVGQLLGRSAYSVREWCRQGRVRAEKRVCGRGSAKEWMISHEELQRIRSMGLLPLPKPQQI